MKQQLVEALAAQFSSHIVKHKMNVEIMLANPMAIHDHTDWMSEVEKPAEGILRTYDFGDSMFYVVPCNCGCGSDHELNVEADETGIWARIYVKTKSNWWNRNRWQNIWTLITRGYVESYTDIHMSKQQALNYAKTLESAIIAVETFRNNRKKPNA